jgi:hypothetical protein
MLRNLLRWARITKSSSDDQQFAAQQMEYLGKVADGAMVFPYGYHGNVPADVLALTASIQGSPDNRAAIGVSPKDRPTLAEGEVAFYHPSTGGFIIWRANGDLDINAGTNKLNITAAETNFIGIVKANGKVIDDTHGHPQGNDSAGDTQANTDGVL